MLGNFLVMKFTDVQPDIKWSINTRLAIQKKNISMFSGNNKD